MTVTMEEVRRHLDPDEVDYPAAARLGPEALPHLRALIEGDDPTLTAKAAYLASLVDDDEAVTLLETASGHADPTVRVAAASGLRNLGESRSGALSDRLLGDADPGVRKMTLRALQRFGSPQARARIERLATEDPEAFVRDVASRSLWQ